AQVRRRAVVRTQRLVTFIGVPSRRSFVARVRDRAAEQHSQGHGDREPADAYPEYRHGAALLLAWGSTTSIINAIRRRRLRVHPYPPAAKVCRYDLERQHLGASR